MSFNDMARLMGWDCPDSKGCFQTKSVAKGVNRPYSGPSKRTLSKRASRRRNGRVQS